MDETKYRGNECATYHCISFASAEQRLLPVLFSLQKFEAQPRHGGGPEDLGGRQFSEYCIKTLIEIDLLSYNVMSAKPLVDNQPALFVLEKVLLWRSNVSVPKAHNRDERSGIQREAKARKRIVGHNKCTILLADGSE